MFGVADRLRPIAAAAAPPIGMQIDGLAASLDQMGAEIGELRPNALAKQLIPHALAEIETIGKEIDGGVEQILASAEQLMSPDGQGDAAEAQAAALFEACVFRDLVGQRLTHVRRLLENIRARLEAAAEQLHVTDADHVETEEERRRRDLLCNGPGLDGPELSQDQVDSLMW